MLRPTMAFFLILVASCPALAWGEVDEAIEAAETKLKNISTWEMYSDKVGKATKAIGLIDPIIKKYETKQTIYSENEISALFTAKGECLYQMFEYEKALENFQLALKHNHENPKALLKVAFILSSAPDDKLRDGTKAKEVAKMALIAWNQVFDKNARNFNVDFDTRDKRKRESATQLLFAFHAAACAMAETEDFKGAVDFLAELKNMETVDFLDLFRNSKKYRLTSKEDEEKKEKIQHEKEKEATKKSMELAEKEKQKEANEAKAKEADLAERKKKLEAREADFAKNNEKLASLDKESREAGKKSISADTDEEAKRWKDVSKKKYAEWKKLKMELDQEWILIRKERESLPAKPKAKQP